MSNRFSALILSALMMMVCTSQVQAISAAALQQGIPSLAPMLQNVTPAVVNIRVSKLVPEARRSLPRDRS